MVNYSVLSYASVDADRMLGLRDSPGNADALPSGRIRLSGLGPFADELKVRVDEHRPGCLLARRRRRQLKS